MFLTAEMHQAALNALHTLVDTAFPELEDPVASLSSIVAPRQRLEATAELLAELRSLRVFWKYHEDLIFGGCNSLVAKDAGLNEPVEIQGHQDYDMPWRLQAMKYRSDDLAVFFSGEPRLNVLERQSNSNGFSYLRTSKVPIRSAERVIGVMGAFEMLSQQDFESTKASHSG